MSEQKPEIAHKAPYVNNEEKSTVYWCSCGRSENQPYCDGSHKGTGFEPIKVELEESGKVAWCGCKQTGNAPYCDGSHNQL